MRSVALCGSIRFRDEIAKWAKVLEKAGVTVYRPDFDWVSDAIALAPEEGRLKDDRYRAHVQTEALTYLWVNIAVADVVFIMNFDESGHIGNNTRGEVFFSHGHHKPIYAFQRDQEEPTTDRLIKDVATTPQELLRFLR